MRKTTLAVSLLVGVLALSARAENPQVVDKQHPHENVHRTLNPNCLDCASCHACDAPTPEDPCLVHCPRHSIQFVGTHEAGDGPDVVIIDQLAGLYGSVTFATASTRRCPT